MESTPTRASPRHRKASNKGRALALEGGPKKRYCRKCKGVEIHEQRHCQRYKRVIRTPNISDTPATTRNAAIADVSPSSPPRNDPQTTHLSSPTIATPSVAPGENEGYPLRSSPTTSHGIPAEIQAQTDFHIDPRLLEEDSRLHNSLGVQPNNEPNPFYGPPSPQRDVHRSRSHSPSTDSTSSTSTASTPLSSPIPRENRLSTSLASNRSKRLRATASNPVFDHINGACRGSKLVNIPRTRKLPAPRTKRVAKHFHERIHALLTRCEDLAHETGCWLYFSAQLPTANVPFTHFTSERLRAEGGTLMNELHDISDRLYDALVSARRRDNAQLASELVAAKEAGTLAAERSARLEAVLLANGIAIPE